MADSLAIMARETVAIGPTGQRVATNVEDLRQARGLKQHQLAGRMQDHGRAVHATVVSKIEQLTRRVDVDDLVTLALALGVTPNRLLLPDAADEASLQLTVDLEVPASDAWQWARGLKPLASELQQAARAGEEVRIQLWERFVRENAPRGSEAGGPFDPVLFYALASDDATMQRTHRVLSVLSTALWAGLSAEALHKLVDAASAIHEAR